MAGAPVGAAAPPTAPGTGPTGPGWGWRGYWQGWHSTYSSTSYTCEWRWGWATSGCWWWAHHQHLQQYWHLWLWHLHLLQLEGQAALHQCLQVAQEGLGLGLHLQLQELGVVLFLVRVVKVAGEEEEHLLTTWGSSSVPAPAGLPPSGAAAAI